MEEGRPVQITFSRSELRRMAVGAGILFLLLVILIGGEGSLIRWLILVFLMSVVVGIGWSVVSPRLGHETAAKINREFTIGISAVGGLFMVAGSVSIAGIMILVGEAMTPMAGIPLIALVPGFFFLMGAQLSLYALALSKGSSFQVPLLIGLVATFFAWLITWGYVEYFV